VVTILKPVLRGLSGAALVTKSNTTSQLCSKARQTRPPFPARGHLQQTKTRINISRGAFLESSESIVQ
jgi:hypothetical protein